MKLKVLYICHSPYALGGAALSLYNLIKSVSDTVDPIVLLQDKGATYDYFTERNIKCMVVKFKNDMRNPCLVKHILGFVPKWILYTYNNSKCADKVVKLLSGTKIDIVHSNATVFTFGYLVAKRLKSKHVWHLREFQDIDFGIAPFTGWKNVKRKMYNSDAVISITSAVHNHWNMDKHKNGFVFWDAVRSKLDCINEQQKDKYIVHCAARLSEAKGTDKAIEAFGNSGLFMSGYRLKLIGLVDQKYKSLLQNIAKSYGCDKYVDYIGFCDDLKPILSRASAFLMCSKNEGLGRVTIEAMFYGCLVIGHRTAGTVEFMKDHINGFLYESTEECADILKSLPTLTDYSAITSNAQQYVIEHFSEEEYGKNILKVYNSVL